MKKCTNKNHIWIFNTEYEKEPYSWQLCFCGKKEYKDRDDKITTEKGGIWKKE